ncbi:hypothetical protein [Deinococcus sp. YIM 77859]|uniref:hypothetical protein n=1 Tax=Deinococcus sp. YIM 77859 TaxID=1540221 RepID=UPI00054E44AC|nr:hypothetical protein [Deinococcus sp. YIM 77859]
MTYQDIFTTELESKRREGARLVDVREDEIESNTVLICASGNRFSQGQIGRMNLSGGTAAWVWEGRDLHQGEQP